MYEKKDYNNDIEYNKSKLKIISDLNSSDDPEIVNRSISKNYSIEETLDSKNLNINGIDINSFKSIRLSQTFGNKELNSQILLDGMAGIKSDDQNNKNENDKEKEEMNIIKAIYKDKEKDKSNNKIIKTEKINNNKGEEIIYIKEYENNESENLSQENEKMNYEVFVKYRENNKLLKQQNELFIEILDGNKDNKKYNKKNRNIIVSNLNEDLNYYTINQDVKTDIENNKDNITTQKFKSLKNFKNKEKNVPINKISLRNKKSKKYSVNEKIYESTNNNIRNNNKKFNKFVNNNNNEINKTNNNSSKIKNLDLSNRMLKYLFYYNTKFIKNLSNNKESRNKFSQNKNNNKNNSKKKGSINIINLGPNINVKYNLKRNKSVKSVFNKNNLSCNSSKDYKMIKKTIKKVNSINNNNKQKEIKTNEKDEKSNNKNIKIKNIPTEFRKYCLNRNLSRKNIDNNNNLTLRNIKKNNINISNANNIEKINEYHKNKLNNASMKKSNSSYKSFKKKNCKINYINKTYLKKNKY